MASSDLTKPIDLTLHAEGTGPRQFRRPEYIDFMPPCNSACPAGENIQAWMAYAQAGDYFEAFQQLVQDNPFPAVMGRVCVRSCETGCNRTHIDSTVSIHGVERYIGDKAIEEKWKINNDTTPTGKRILVVGAGPSGLSAAYHLTRLGHTVEIYEAGANAGGLMEYGIPEYRLPKNILEAEVVRIVNMGVKIKLNYKVTDLLQEKEAGRFDAVYLAVGAEVMRKSAINIDSSIIMTDAFTFLKASKLYPSIRGNKVVIYGGSKLAMYLSRIIRRLGAEAIVLFPGDRKLMPAYDYEADDAIEEGVNIKFLRRIDTIKGKTFTVEVMKVEKGKSVGTAEFITLEADMFIDSLKQESDSAFLHGLTNVAINEDGTVVINAERMTSQPGVFAGGDMLAIEQRSVTIAIGQGKKAARYIDAYVNHIEYVKPAKHPTVGYRKLHMWYKTESPQIIQSKQDPSQAVKNFDEIIFGFNEREARFEAQRCLSCGNCFECDGCFGACPEDAIVKLGKGKGYRFDFDACTGCGVCYEQCPCHAIEMIPEPVKTN